MPLGKSYFYKNPLVENQGRDESQVSTFIYDTIAYLNKNNKFQGGNYLGGNVAITRSKSCLLI